MTDFKNAFDNFVSLKQHEQMLRINWHFKNKSEMLVIWEMLQWHVHENKDGAAENRLNWLDVQAKYVSSFKSISSWSLGMAVNRLSQKGFLKRKTIKKGLSIIQHISIDIRKLIDVLSADDYPDKGLLELNLISTHVPQFFILDWMYKQNDADWMYVPLQKEIHQIHGKENNFQPRHTVECMSMLITDKVVTSLEGKKRNRLTKLNYKTIDRLLAAFYNTDFEELAARPRSKK